MTVSGHGQQLSLSFDRRRIDITLERLDKALETLSKDEGETLQQKDWFPIVVLVARVRAMERAEEEPRQRHGWASSAPLADTYDRIVQPGVGHPVDAILRTFKATFMQREVR